MLNEWTSIVPKAALAAALVWGGSNYLLIAPEVAARVVRADHLPACETTLQNNAARAAEARIAEVPEPVNTRSQDMAMSELQRLSNGPYGDLWSMFGLDMATNMAMADIESAKQSAAAAYDSAIERINRETALVIDTTGSLCGCLAETSIAQTRNDWTIFTATLGLIQPAPVRDIPKRMAHLHAAGTCLSGEVP